LFKREFHDGIRAGNVTVAYRWWKRAAARPGGRHRFDVQHVVEIEDVAIINERALTDASARAAGYEDRITALRELSRYSSPGSALYQIKFRCIRESDPRAALAQDDALSDVDLSMIVMKLRRMDASSNNGPWTLQTLKLIGERPATLSTILATELGRERMAFKADVRKLKALGLTISLERGYKLSPRGRAVLRRLERPA
jgi:hypothetical protein